MVRVAISAVEVIAPDGTKSFWVTAMPHSKAVAAVRKVIPPDHKAELSIRNLLRSPKLEGLRPGEVRKIETVASPKRHRGHNQMAQSMIDLGKGERPDRPEIVSEYRAYAIASDGLFIGFGKMICRDDGEAVAKAKWLLKGRDIEVWNGGRFVIRLVQRPKSK